MTFLYNLAKIRWMGIQVVQSGARQHGCEPTSTSRTAMRHSRCLLPGALVGENRYPSSMNREGGLSAISAYCTAQCHGVCFHMLAGHKRTSPKGSKAGAPIVVE